MEPAEQTEITNVSQGNSGYFYGCVCILSSPAALLALTAQLSPRGWVGSAVARRAIDLKIRGSSPAHGSSRIAG